MALLLVGLVLWLAPSLPSRAGAALDRITSSGKMVVATDPAWPPFSSRDAQGAWSGFDIEVAREIAGRIGAEASFVTPTWEAQLAGHWNGQWDVCVCSMTPTAERAKNLDFPSTYYWSPVNLAVSEADTSSRVPADLSGKKIGILVPSTYEIYLRGLPTEGTGMEAMVPKIKDPVIVPFASDAEAFDALTKGKTTDAVIDYLPVLIFEIKQGRPMRIIGTPLYYVSNAMAIDQGDPELAALLGKTVEAMRADGTLGALSMKWFQFDLSKAP
jgi:polar amino acid transport system substrate-binding protein